MEKIKFLPIKMIQKREKLDQSFTEAGGGKSPDWMENINIEEENLIDDNELKRMGVVMIEDKLKNLYQSLEREIMLIKQRFGKKINKFETALEFLKINPHLKNLKEYEDYSKFSKFLDQSKFSVYSSKSGFDESIGGQSILPLNTIKVTKYKNNDINEKNK